MLANYLASLAMLAFAERFDKAVQGKEVVPPRVQMAVCESARNDYNDSIPEK